MRTSRRPWAFLLLCLLLWQPVSARAAIVGHTPQGDFIHEITAPNGQRLYFLSMETEPTVQQEDVNFDGQADLVVLTARGASNFFYEFFVFSKGRYDWAPHPGSEQGLANYTLHPQQGLVLSYASNGMAGALSERVLYAWQGGELRMRRSLHAQPLVTTTYPENRIHTVTDDSKLWVRVFDYGAPGEGRERALVYEAVLEAQQLTNEDFDRMDQALWEGLR